MSLVATEWLGLSRLICAVMVDESKDPNGAQKGYAALSSSLPVSGATPISTCFRCS